MRYLTRTANPIHFFSSSTRNRISAEIYYMHSAHTFNFTINENQIKLWRKKRTKAHAFFSSFFYYFLPVLYKYTANFVRFSVSSIQSEPINPIFCHRKLNINQRKSMPTIFAEKFWVTQWNPSHTKRKLHTECRLKLSRWKTIVEKNREPERRKTTKHQLKETKRNKNGEKW